LQQTGFALIECVLGFAHIVPAEIMEIPIVALLTGLFGENFHHKVGFGSIRLFLISEVKRLLEKTVRANTAALVSQKPKIKHLLESGALSVAKTPAPKTHSQSRTQSGRNHRRASTKSKHSQTI